MICVAMGAEKPLPVPACSRSNFKYKPQPSHFIAMAPRDRRNPASILRGKRNNVAGTRPHSGPTKVMSRFDSCDYRSVSGPRYSLHPSLRESFEPLRTDDPRTDFFAVNRKESGEFDGGYTKKYDKDSNTLCK